MKLQLFISHSGICSRRSAFDAIKSGQVKVNGQIIREPSFDVNPAQDKVLFNNQLVQQKNKLYILFHKPEGITVTKKDKFAEKTVFDLLPKNLQHLHPVGRLDKDTSGLLILTNDGDFTFKLTHPKFEVQKKYEIVLDRNLLSADRAKLEKGVFLEEGRTVPCRIEYPMRKRGDEVLVSITIHEGKKRQIRRMFAEFGYTVLKLKRVSEGKIKLGDLKPGQWRLLNEKEI